MDGAVALYAREQANEFQPLPQIPENEHSEYISYIFINFTGERWVAELLVDPMFFDVIDPAWTSLVAELNAHILPYFSIHDRIGGYYPICTSNDAHFESPLTCLRLTKSSVQTADVLVPNLVKNFDTLCYDRLRNMTEIRDVLGFLGLPDDLRLALQDDTFAMFAYLSQLAILKVLPFDACHAKVSPYVIDADGNLSFGQGTHIQCLTRFATFMNEFFFANVYEGYQYLAGEYPIIDTDVVETRQRTLEGMEPPNDLFESDVRFCFSDFVPNTMEERKFYVETWCNAVVKRCYMIALLKAIAYNVASTHTI